MKKFIAVLIVLTMLVIPLTSCGTKKSSSNFSNDQEYSTVYSGEVTTFNYLTTSSEDEYAAASNLVDCLIEQDAYGVIKPCLATSWNVSSDGLTWTFNLRKGVKWVTYDGKDYAEVTAQDWVDAMKYILTSKNASSTANIVYGVIKNAEDYYNGKITDFSQVGVKAKDKYTLVYTLKKPTPYFLSMLTYVCFFPVNGKFLSDAGDKFGTDNEHLLYNGAYLLQTFEPQNSRIFVKNENYWDKEHVYITKLNYTYNKEADTLSPELYLRGQISDTSIPTASLDEWMKNSSKKDKVRPANTNFYSYFYALNFNPKFDKQYDPDNWKIAVNDLNFRLSLFHALDRKAAMSTEEPFGVSPKLVY